MPAMTSNENTIMATEQNLTNSNWFCENFYWQQNVVFDKYDYYKLYTYLMISTDSYSLSNLARTWAASSKSYWISPKLLKYKLNQLFYWQVLLTNPHYRSWPGMSHMYMQQAEDNDNIMSVAETIIIKHYFNQWITS